MEPQLNNGPSLLPHENCTAMRPKNTQLSQAILDITAGVSP